MLLLSTLFLGFLSNGKTVTYAASPDCEWTVDPNNFDFDLEAIKGGIFAINSSQWTYYYSPCKNGLICADDNVMADQVNIQTEACTSYLAKKNDSVLPVYKDKAYVFTFNNGMDGYAFFIFLTLFFYLILCFCFPYTRIAIHLKTTCKNYKIKS